MGNLHHYFVKEYQLVGNLHHYFVKEYQLVGNLHHYFVKEYNLWEIYIIILLRSTTCGKFTSLFC